jgi:hypothetical protein
VLPPKPRVSVIVGGTDYDAPPNFSRKHKREEERNYSREPDPHRCVCSTARLTAGSLHLRPISSALTQKKRAIAEVRKTFRGDDGLHKDVNPASHARSHISKKSSVFEGCPKFPFHSNKTTSPKDSKLHTNSVSGWMPLPKSATSPECSPGLLSPSEGDNAEA